MSEEEQYESKRERQKARRAQRLEQEAVQAKVQDRKRTLTYGLVVVLVVSLIGLLVFQQIQKRADANAAAERATAKLTELGCTEDARQPDLGGGHITGDAASLAAEAPATIYPDPPPSSGRHIGSVVPSGVFDVKIDPRYTTHNLEHGYIVAWYDADAPADQVDALKAWAQEEEDGDHPKIIVAEYYEPLSGDANFAYTAWFFKQTCRDFDTDVASTFLRAHYDIDGEGPEKGIPAHNLGAQGVVDPDGNDLFLPPLDTEFGTTSGLEDPATDESATDTDPDVTPSAEDGSEPASSPTEAATE